MSRQATDTSLPQTASSAGGQSVTSTPVTSASDTPKSGSSIALATFRTRHDSNTNMDEKVKEDATTAGVDKQEPSTVKSDANQDDDATKASKKKSKCHKPKHKSKGKSAKKSGAKKAANNSDSESESDESESDTESSEDSSSEDECRKRKAAKKQSKKSKDKKRRNKKKAQSDSEDSSSDDTDSDASSDGGLARKKKKKAGKKSKRADSEVEDVATETEGSEDITTMETQLKDLMSKLAEKRARPVGSGLRWGKMKQAAIKSPKATKSRSKKKGDPLSYKRVDQLWDSSIHNYKLKESAEDDVGEFAEYAFLVRRRFDWENKYLSTVIDIKSKQLRTVLVDVMKDCKSVSLEAEEPVIDPNTLFLYLEALRTHYKKTLKSRISKEKKRKNIKKLEQQKTLCKTLVKWIDEDYEDTKKTLYPLLEAGNITFDLLWALFSPNDIAITSCYGSWDEPRCFKVDYAMKYTTMVREYYCVEGKYMEYDGKNFGMGDFEADIDSFKGPRKITSLATYPLKYHKNPEAVKKQIISRGEKFVGMDGMQYKFHKGLAFMKKKKQVLKISINSRIMVDPATFRRINPNYPISLIKPKDEDDLFAIDSGDDDCSCCDSDLEDAHGGDEKLDADLANSKEPQYKYKWSKDDKGRTHFVQIEVDENGDPIRPQDVDKLAEVADNKKRAFTEDQLLLTSPVVLGFAFSEKLWLEFSLSGVHEIDYNDDAFDSLVLPPKEKSIVRALVESHKFHGAKTIDDVIQGKGKGLVVVLHGPPGTGKTLTAEGISELLRCPLYMVSAGELGTDPARLEHELQKILDIAHSWGAVLLLDEADVFLEKRETHDIHRNALVSIFLRLLEYFQGKIFLTTNRVETFDDAFQSRIHLALRYAELDSKAKLAIWRQHLDRVRKQENSAVSITDHDLTSLSRHNLNGRQIKNIVRTAQALALSEKSVVKLEHIKRVLDVQETFERDLKGGTGYLDAMRSYT